MKRDTSQELFISKAKIILQRWSYWLMASDQSENVFVHRETHMEEEV